MKFQLTKLEKSWILYDIGNSAFILMVSTIIPIYFNYLAENAGISSVDYLASWGYAASAATLFVAISGPVLGTLADHKGDHLDNDESKEKAKIGDQWAKLAGKQYKYYMVFETKQPDYPGAYSLERFMEIVQGL